MTGYNFTDAVRWSLQAAREEAAALVHEYVGTEHLLLGLLRADDGIPIAVLNGLGVPLDDLRKATLDLVRRGAGRGGSSPDLPYTSRAKKVLEEAMTEARNLRHNYVGTEHLFLGLLREGKGVGAQVLMRHGVTLDVARAAVLHLMEPGATAENLDPARAPRRRAASFLIVIEDPHGNLGARRFTDVQQAIEFLKQWGGGPGEQP